MAPVTAAVTAEARASVRLDLQLPYEAPPSHPLLDQRRAAEARREQPSARRTRDDRRRAELALAAPSAAASSADAARRPRAGLVVGEAVLGPAARHRRRPGGGRRRTVDEACQAWTAGSGQTVPCAAAEPQRGATRSQQFMRRRIRRPGVATPRSPALNGPAGAARRLVGVPRRASPLRAPVVVPTTASSPSLWRGVRSGTVSPHRRRKTIVHQAAGLLAPGRPGQP